MMPRMRNRARPPHEVTMPEVARPEDIVILAERLFLEGDAPIAARGLTGATLEEVAAPDDPEYPEGLDRSAEAVATERGLIVVYDQSTLLLLDLDTPEQEQMYSRRHGWLHNQLLPVSVFETRSQHNKRHVYWRLREQIHPGIRIGIQTALGSDPVRSYLDTIRLALKVPQASNVLFETNHWYPLVEQWLERTDPRGR